MKQLRYFVAAVECGQISMAATREHVSQSAVTAAISALEGILGTRLFERHAQGVTVTLDGSDFYNNARRVIDSLSDALYRSRSRSRETEGVVRVGASYTVMGYFLPDVLARFRASYPNITFDLHDLPRTLLEEAVVRGEIDVGVSLLSNTAHIDRFHHRTLIRSQRKLWLAPSHPLAATEKPSLKDIANYDYVLITADEGEQSTMRYWGKNRLTPKVILRTGSMEALRGLVSHGFAVTILSEMVFRPWSLEGKRIEARTLAEHIPQMEVGMIWQKGAIPPPPVQSFIDFLTYSQQA